MVLYRTNINLTATHVGHQPAPSTKRPCRRCGITLTRGATTGYCKDCRTHKPKDDQ